MDGRKPKSITLKKKKKKYKYNVPVYIEAVASLWLGTIKCNSIEEYKRKAERLWEKSGYDAPSVNISNKYDMGEGEMSPVKKSDLEYHVIKKVEK